MNKQSRGNIWKLYFGALLGGFAFFYNAIDTLYYRHFNLSFQQIGWTISAGLIATVLMEAPSGAFADLYGKKRALVIAAVSNFLATALVAFGSSFQMFLFGFTLWGIGRAFNSGASSALLFDSLKKLGQEKKFIKHVGRMSSIFISVDVVSGALGPLMFAANVRLPYFISLGFAFFVILIQLSLDEVLVVKRKAENVLVSHFQQMISGFKTALRSKIFVWLTLFSILIFTAGKVFAEMITTPFLINYVGYTLQNLSVIGFIGSLIQASFVFFADKFEYKLGDRRSFLVTILTIPMTTILFALSRNLILTAILSGFGYSFWSFGEVVAENYLSHNVTDDKRATVLSISSMLVSVFALVSLPILGSLVDRISLMNSLLMLAVGFTILGGLLLMKYRGKE